MELQSIIGQLFILGFHGDSIRSDSPIAHDISKRNLGGVILFDRSLAFDKAENNIRSRKQLVRLTHDLQTLGDGKLLIGIDQEGGRVSRLKEAQGFPTFPSAFEVGRTAVDDFSMKQAEQTAALLAELGITVNFAPVADLHINPANPIIAQYQRSYSSLPDQVAKQCEIFIEAHRKRNILCALKHFPGHGSSRTDSHLGFVDISESWREEELLPYKTLMQKNKVDAVMMGHLYHRGMDSNFPASLSAKIIDRTLRQELQFNGAVITDDIQMKAITNRYAVEDAALLALSAGADLIIIGNNLKYDENILQKSIAVIEKAVNSGTLDYGTIEKAWSRVRTIQRMIIK